MTLFKLEITKCILSNKGGKEKLIKDRTFYLRANQFVKNTIDGRPNVASLPEFARVFINQYWSKLLLKIYSRDGAAWIHAIDVIDDKVLFRKNPRLKMLQSRSFQLPSWNKVQRLL